MTNANFGPLKSVALAMLVLSLVFQGLVLSSIPARADEQCVAIPLNTSAAVTAQEAKAQGMQPMAVGTVCSWSCSAACALAVGAGCAVIVIGTGGTATPLVLGAGLTVSACCALCDAHFC